MWEPQGMDDFSESDPEAVSWDGPEDAWENEGGGFYEEWDGPTAKEEHTKVYYQGKAK